jgi:uncharacterized protein (TIGR02996 family)
MNEEAALLEAIANAPDDDSVRFVYAAWLEEHGKPVPAEYLRKLWSEGPLGLRGTQEWLGPIVRRHRSLEFHRGLPSIASYTYEPDLKRPVDEVEIVELAASPFLVLVRHLAIGGNSVLSDNAARALAASPHLRWLVGLDLTGSQIGSQGLAALLVSGNLSRLEVLKLCGRGGLVDWASTETWVEPCIQPDALRVLVGHPAARRLRALDLRLNNLDDGTAGLLLASPHLAQLEELHLFHGNRLSEQLRLDLRERFGDKVC